MAMKNEKKIYDDLVCTNDSYSNDNILCKSI